MNLLTLLFQNHGCSRPLSRRLERYSYDNEDCSEVREQHCEEEAFLGEEHKRKRRRVLQAACHELASTDFFAFCASVPDFPHNASTSDIEATVRSCEEIQPLLLMSGWTEGFLEEVLSM